MGCIPLNCLCAAKMNGSIVAWVRNLTMKGNLANVFTYETLFTRD